MFVSIVVLLLLLCASDQKKVEVTDVALIDRNMLLFSTLNGTLVAVDKTTGDTLWSIKHKPAVNNHYSSSNYLYLPDPKDGSLYMSDPNRGSVKKLPFTIPELVQISPTQTSDGLLYSASKQDSWLAVDILTGQKIFTFSNQQGFDSICPAVTDKQKLLYIPLIEYRVAVMDSVSRQIKWNITYMQYGSQAYQNRQARDLVYFCSNSDGAMMSVNALTGIKVWDKLFDSPVIGVYSVENDKSLRRIPFTSLAYNTLESLTSSNGFALTDELGHPLSKENIKPSFFIGFHKGKPYILESLTKESNIKDFPPIFSDSPLIEGPELDSQVVPNNIVPLGHFCFPEHDGDSFESLLRHYAQSNKETVISLDSVITRTTFPESSPITTYNSETLDALIPRQMIIFMLTTVVLASLVASVIAVILTKYTSGPNNQHNVVSSSISRENSLHDSQHSQSSNEAINANSSRDSISVNGSSGFKNKIGKIHYNTQDVIGKGSHGTIVFKGEFDSRPIAVKRIINECFDLVDREVSLLRESDQHPNVIRYFCMEGDSVFHYIALELCTATLHEYVEGHKMNDYYQINEKQIIFEAISGVAHLHNLGIVHRDIKPQNVLLTVKSPNCVKALISDFGLCRKLPRGQRSFTAQSGIIGTEGWIAPEMFQDETRVTCSVDIFAMGCLIYYVLSGGNHPFGSSLKRQANIKSGDFHLSHLIGEDRCTAEHLIGNMISFNYKFRPTAEEVLCHCLFWSKARQLSFFQDVSDRIEKEQSQSHIIQALERNAIGVVKGDWRDVIGDELRQDLRKFRSYQGTSLRDLLRAMRNKKHHYQELSETLKSSLGEMPDGFVHYFTSRFPSLLVHTYKQMELCKHEPIFRSYYKFQSN